MSGCDKDKQNQVEGKDAVDKMTTSVQEVNRQLAKVRPKYQSTLASGVNQEVWKQAEFKAAWGMEVDEVYKLLADMAADVKKLSQLASAQTELNKQFAAVVVAVNGEIDKPGIRERLKTLEFAVMWIVGVGATVVGALTITGIVTLFKTVATIAGGH
jgi:hypothetical protein